VKEKLSRVTKRAIARSRKRNRKSELLYLGNHHRWSIAGYYANIPPAEMARKLSMNAIYGKIAVDPDYGTNLDPFRLSLADGMLSDPSRPLG